MEKVFYIAPKPQDPTKLNKVSRDDYYHYKRCYDVAKVKYISVETEYWCCMFIQPC